MKVNKVKVKTTEEDLSEIIERLTSLAAERRHETIEFGSLFALLPVVLEETAKEMGLTEKVDKNELYRFFTNVITTFVTAVMVNGMSQKEREAFFDQISPEINNIWRKSA